MRTVSLLAMAALLAHLPLSAASERYISIQSSPTPSQRFAAEELRDFVCRITGERLKIVEGAASTNVAYRIANRTEDGEDAFCISSCRSVVEIAGGCRGVLYGVYEFLERFGGCRWYSATFSKVPRKPALIVPDGFRDCQKPAFRYRLSGWLDNVVGRKWRACDFTVRSRINAVDPTPVKYGGVVYQFGGALGQCHSFRTLLPIERYAKEHPEYYALHGGSRRTATPFIWCGQPCLTNPDVLRIVTSNLLARIRKDPGKAYYNVSQNDNRWYCECEACRRIDEEESSHSGTMIRFVNAVAAAVEREFPDVKIQTLAYQYTRKPPKKTRPRHNVSICLCDIECDMSRPIPNSDDGENRSFRADLEGWCRLTRNIYVWDYTTNFNHYLCQMDNFDALVGNARFFRDCGITDVFEQGNSVGHHGYFGEWKAYLISKLLWNPDVDVRALEEDFFNGYYGKAGPTVLRIYRRTLELQRTFAASHPYHLGVYDDVMKEPFTPDFYDDVEQDWHKAIAAVAHDDKQVRDNVLKSSLYIDYARVMYGRTHFSLDRQLAPIDPHKLQAGARRLLENMDGDRPIRFSEGGGDTAVRTIRWMAAAKPEQICLPKSGEMEENHFRACEPKWAKIVEDPLAGNGAAMEFLPWSSRWNTLYVMSDFPGKPGVRYRLRARIRVVRDPDKAAGKAFWIGVYDHAARKPSLQLEPNVADVKDDVYVWYEIGSWVPSKGEHLWMGAPPRDKDGPAVKGVFLDKLEFTPCPTDRPEDLHKERNESS